mgnify:CR=1 FL=1
MEAHYRQLIVYQTPDGVEPFADWFLALRDAEAAARIARRLDRLENGNWGDCKTVVLLLLGGDKKTQEKDIKTAKVYWREYRERKP